MAIGLLHAVSALLCSWSRNMSRAARKLSIRRSGDSRYDVQSCSKERGSGDEDMEVEVEDDGVWRRTILMGEKCQPLDFSGVIYYDADGRRLSEVPTPRSPMRSPLPSFATTRPITVGYVS